MITDKNILISLHKKHVQEAEDFKSWRFPQWKENYDMFNDKLKENLLTNGVNVNVPAIREALKSWFAGIDEPPEITFKNREKDNKGRDKEIKLNALWQKFYKDEQLEQKDQLDKKNVGQFGRGFKYISWNNAKKFVELKLLSPHDILVPRDIDPLDLNSARYIKHINIFKRLDEVLDNKEYDKEELNRMKLYYIRHYNYETVDIDNNLSLQEKEQLLSDTISRYDNQTFADKTVQMQISYDLVYDKGESVRYVRIYIENQFLVYDKPIKEWIGIDRLPIVSWATDPDLFNFWSLGHADNIRPINKIINKFFKQDIDNRTLQNYGMYFFNTLKGKFMPTGFKPRPFGMFGVPGDPREMIQQVEIPRLGDTSNQIEYMKNMAESSVAQTPTRRGEADGQRTLGEVQIDLTQSSKVTNVDVKQYRNSWIEIATIFVELLEHNQRGLIGIEKENSQGLIFQDDISLNDWKSDDGYVVVPEYKDDKLNNDNRVIQETQYVINNFIDNPVAIAIARKKQLQALNYSPEEIEQVMAYTESQTQAIQDPEQNTLVDNQAYSMENGGVEGLNQKQNEPIA